MLYVWYGRGSPKQEREAALKYAQNLAAKGSTVVELTEAASADDEMFWMMLGTDDYAKADYWTWRSAGTNFNPSIWRIDADNGRYGVSLVIKLNMAYY